MRQRPAALALGTVVMLVGAANAMAEAPWSAPLDVGPRVGKVSAPSIAFAPDGSALLDWRATSAAPASETEQVLVATLRADGRIVARSSLRARCRRAVALWRALCRRSAPASAAGAIWCVAPRASQRGSGTTERTSGMRNRSEIRSGDRSFDPPAMTADGAADVAVRLVDTFDRSRSPGRIGCALRCAAPAGRSARRSHRRSAAARRRAARASLDRLSRSEDAASCCRRDTCAIGLVSAATRAVVEARHAASGRGLVAQRLGPAPELHRSTRGGRPRRTDGGGVGKRPSDRHGRAIALDRSGSDPAARLDAFAPRRPSIQAPSQALESRRRSDSASRQRHGHGRLVGPVPVRPAVWEELEIRCCQHTPGRAVRACAGACHRRTRLSDLEVAPDGTALATWSDDQAAPRRNCGGAAARRPAQAFMAPERVAWVQPRGRAHRRPPPPRDSARRNGRPFIVWATTTARGRPRSKGRRVPCCDSPHAPTSTRVRHPPALSRGQSARHGDRAVGCGCRTRTGARHTRAPRAPTPRPARPRRRRGAPGRGSGRRFPLVGRRKPERRRRCWNHHDHLLPSRRAAVLAARMGGSRSLAESGDAPLSGSGGKHPAPPNGLWPRGRPP